MKIGDIVEYLQVYREYSHRIIGCPHSLVADLPPPPPFDRCQGCLAPVEMRAIEAFTVFPCSDGAVALGCGRILEPASPNSIASAVHGVRVAPPTTKPILQCLNNLLGGPEAVFTPVPSFLESEYLRPYERRELFGSFLVRTDFHGYWPVWDAPPFPSRSIWLPPWMMIFAIGSDSHPPRPEELARHHWQRHYIEKNLGSLEGGRSLARRFADLLEHSRREEEVQLFIEDHPELIAPDYRKCYPKFRLANECVTDFVIDSHEAYEFVEIESPHKPIFTRSGRLHHLVAQAEDQILQWRMLIEQDHDFFERRLPRLYRPKFRLIYGRNRSLSSPLRNKIRARFTDLVFETYDDVLERFYQTLKNLSGSY